ncbi:MAG: hypothetical protein ACI86H_002775 [bacterium]|jgi:hypothetical protein
MIQLAKHIEKHIFFGNRIRIKINFIFREKLSIQSNFLRTRDNSLIRN